jgi:hypothetical protein
MLANPCGPASASPVQMLANPCGRASAGMVGCFLLDIMEEKFKKSAVPDEISGAFLDDH